MKTILEEIEARGIVADYGCREGVCGMCQVELLGGSVSYGDKIPMASLIEGRILPCCCRKASLQIIVRVHGELLEL